MSVTTWIFEPEEVEAAIELYMVEEQGVPLDDIQKSEMTADEKKILREIAAWFPSWQTLRLEKDGDIGIFTDYGYCNYYFGFAEESSQAYEVLAPILEKYGEINLDEYREKINE